MSALNIMALNFYFLDAEFVCTFIVGKACYVVCLGQIVAGTIGLSDSRYHCLPVQTTAIHKQ